MGLVASCELAIFATKSSRRDQNLVPATSPTNSNWFEFVGLVGEAVHTMRLVPGDLLQGLVAGTSPIACADL